MSDQQYISVSIIIISKRMERQTDGRTDDVSFVFKQHRYSAVSQMLRHSSPDHDSAVCGRAGGLAVALTVW
jgi:hypothetical protein